MRNKCQIKKLFFDSLLVIKTLHNTLSLMLFLAEVVIKNEKKKKKIAAVIGNNSLHITFVYCLI